MISVWGRLSARMLWIVASLLVVVAGVGVILLIEPRFYFVDDSQIAAFGQWYRIGQRVVAGDWAPLDPSVWQAGNYQAESAWGFYSPLLWLVGLGALAAADAAVYVTIVKLCFTLIAATGIYLVARGYRVAAPLAALAASTAVFAGTVVYLDAASWANGLMGWSLVPLAWWGARRTIVDARHPAPALLAGAALVGIGYVHSTLVYGAVIAACAVEVLISRRGRGALLRAVCLGGIALCMVIVVHLPGALTAPASGRGLGVGNTGLLTVDLSGIASSAIPAGSSGIDFFGVRFPAAPLTYISWLLPLAALVSWRRFGRVLARNASLPIVAGIVLLVALGPSDVGPLRFPVRMMSFVSLAVVLLLVVGLSRARVRRITRGRIVAVAVIAASSSLFALMQTPRDRVAIAVVLVVLLVGLLLALGAARRGRSVGRMAAILLVWGLAVTATGHGFAPRSPLPDYPGYPSSTDAYRAVLPEARGDVLVVGTPEFSPRSWQETLLGNTWYASGSSVVNTYSTVYYPAFQRMLCMEYRGNTCSELEDRVFAEVASTGETLADLMSVSTVQLVRSSDSAPQHGVDVPAGWHVADTGEVTTTLVRDEPRPGAGGVVWSSGADVEEISHDATTVRFRVSGIEDAPARVVLSRLPWPGYTVEGGAAVEPMAGFLMQVEVPADGVVSVRYTPPGSTAVLVAGIIAVLATAAWVLLLAFRRRLPSAVALIGDRWARTSRPGGDAYNPGVTRTESEGGRATAEDAAMEETPAPPAGMRGELGPLFRLVRDQRVAFLLVGATNTVVGFAWFILFDATVGRLWGYMVTLVCAHIASVLCAFVLYRRFVFRVRGNTLVDLVRFEMVYLVALGINAVLLPLLVELANLPVLLAQALIVFVTTLVSFFGHREFSFRRKKES